MALVSGGFVLTLALVFHIGRDGGIHTDGIVEAVRYTVTMYVSLLGIMAGFFFGESRSRGTTQRVKLQTLVFACCVTLLWVSFPPFLLGCTSLSIEDVIRVLETASMFGSTLAALAISYFFAKTAGSS